MKEEFTEYLLGLGMTEPLIKRVEELLDIYSRSTQYEIEDIYISEYLKEDGRREYEDLRIYSSDCYCLCHSFITENELILSNHKLVTSVHLERDNYDFSEARTNSKLSLYSFFYATPATMTLKATGLNCDKLNKIFQKYIKPYIARGYSDPRRVFLP